MFSFRSIPRCCFPSLLPLILQNAKCFPFNLPPPSLSRSKQEPRYYLLFKSVPGDRAAFFHASSSSSSSSSSLPSSGVVVNSDT
ncbi:hypothetical protein E2C01_054139 [Portunus trituberculatus]|uniref:Uncharacterized protein n=1 Tax=Portunus trituberculatus TaxID=210409 RepID=A0A5B7GMA0_PORTR|nr:hypothetical protein [Portunus trituberculatus]